MSRVTHESTEGWRKRLLDEPMCGVNHRPTYYVIEWVGRRGQRGPMTGRLVYYWGAGTLDSPAPRRRHLRFVLSDAVEDGDPFRVTVERKRR